jgi:hypothetical protein
LGGISVAVSSVLWWRGFVPGGAHHVTSLIRYRWVGRIPLS